ncbi:hypothetical protein GZL_05672 [Streptomyces sp. 769]|nr:hypothetical protein GZL_05672 [Streptomyces sp. 769]
MVHGCSVPARPVPRSQARTQPRLCPMSAHATGRRSPRHR